MKADRAILESDQRPAPRAASAIKTILLHVQKDSGFETRLQTALSVARATSAHIHLVHVTPIEAYVTMDTWGGVFFMDKVAKRIDEEEEKLRLEIESRLKAEDVSWDYEQTTSYAALDIIRQAALVDLVISGREPHSARSRRPELAVLGDILTSVRTPLLIPDDGKRAFDPLGEAVIAWNGSYEAANAVRQSLGLLKLASRVSILQISENSDRLFPNTRILEYLSRHDVHAQLIVQEAARGHVDGNAIAATIVSHARGAAYLVLGGYGHSRLGEYVFGGVTRTLLKDCPVPLLIAH